MLATMPSDAFSAAAARVVDYLNTHTSMSDWSVNRVAGGEQVHLHVSGAELIGVGDRVPWDETFCRRVVEEGDTPVVADALVAPGYRDLPMAGAVRGYAGQPIRDDDGALFGMLCGVSPEPLGDDAIDVDLVRLLSDLLASHLGMSRRLEEGQQERRIAEALAQTDALTGLMNRRGWDAVLADATIRTSAYGDLAAVLVVDLDGLKTVNDTLGHAHGDALLQRAALALDAAKGEHDTLARYGGDEFAVLVEQLSTRRLAATLRRYRAAFEQRGIDASMGWGLVNPGDEPADAAFARADAAMYEDKQARRAAGTATVPR